MAKRKEITLLKAVSHNSVAKSQGYQRCHHKKNFFGQPMYLSDWASQSAIAVLILPSINKL